MKGCDVVLKWIIIFIFVVMLSYVLISFVQMLEQMSKDIIFPVTEEELETIRKRPEKPINRPNFQDQKRGLIIYIIYLLFIITMFVFVIIYDPLNFAFYPFVLISLIYMNDVMNMFAISEKGILIGDRFIGWKWINYFYFEKIDMNHKFYGYAKEVNDQYELKFKLKFMTVSCLILSDETKEHVRKMLLNYIPEK